MLRKVTSSFLCFAFITHAAYASVDLHRFDGTHQPPPIGNFALTGSQQPGPFYAFGQNIITKHQAQLFVFPNYTKNSRHQRFAVVAPSLLYGITNEASVIVTAPYATHYANRLNESSGFTDTFIQGEVAVYENATGSFTEQATVIGNISLATGSTRKRPATGIGTNSFFVGGTYNRMYTQWWWFVSPGAQRTQKLNQFQYGTEYFAQAGIGHVLFSKTDKLIFSTLLEIDSEFNARNTLRGKILANSGGHLTFITPSIWVSTPHLTIQIGVALPLLQQWHGRQNTTNYFSGVNLAWTWNDVRLPL